MAVAQEKTEPVHIEHEENAESQIEKPRKPSANESDSSGVLLDLGAAHLEGAGSDLKLAKDGHVS